MSKLIKQYSFAEKRKFWGSELDRLFNIQVGKNGRKRTKAEQERFEYAQGFYSSSKNGNLSKNFNDLTFPKQLGEIAGFKAKKTNK